MSLKSPRRQQNWCSSNIVHFFRHFGSLGVAASGADEIHMCVKVDLSTSKQNKLNKTSQEMYQKMSKETGAKTYHPSINSTK